MLEVRVAAVRAHAEVLGDRYSRGWRAVRVGARGARGARDQAQAREVVSAEPERHNTSRRRQRNVHIQKKIDESLRNVFVVVAQKTQRYSLNMLAPAPTPAGFTTHGIVSSQFQRPLKDQFQLP